MENKAQKYNELQHAMQAGIEVGSKELLPKHLRVGINTALSDHSSLVKLLFKKGIISDDEYLDTIIEGMQKEVEEYEQKIKKRTGMDVTLG